MAISNIIQVAHQDPLALPPFTDIANGQHLYDLIMSNLESENPSLSYFGLTPVHKIPTGW